MTDQTNPTGDQPLRALGLSAEQMQMLMQPLHPARVQTRSQGGRELSYVEAWDVRATLIRAFGFGGFSIETLDSGIVHKELREREGQRPIWDVAVKAHVQLTIPALTAAYSEAAVAMQSNPDFGEAADFAVKTAVSDALKRCATNLGTQFGLSLYDNGATREIIRVVYEPVQASLLASVQRPRTAEQNAALSQSLGASSDAPEGQEP